MAKIYTLLAWHPLLVELLGVATSQRFFTIITTTEGAAFFDGDKSGLLTNQCVFKAFVSFDNHAAILQGIWYGNSLVASDYQLLFDRMTKSIRLCDKFELQRTLIAENEICWPVKKIETNIPPIDIFQGWMEQKFIGIVREVKSA